eukprot:PhF_6_TR2567/c0_g2_i1/m.4351
MVNIRVLGRDGMCSYVDARCGDSLLHILSSDDTLSRVGYFETDLDTLHFYLKRKNVSVKEKLILGDACLPKNDDGYTVIIRDSACVVNVPAPPEPSTRSVLSLIPSRCVSTAPEVKMVTTSSEMTDLVQNHSFMLQRSISRIEGEIPPEVGTTATSTSEPAPIKPRQLPQQQPPLPRDDVIMTLRPTTSTSEPIKPRQPPQQQPPLPK